MYYQIERGDRVVFVNIKYLKLPTKTKYNIPLCLWKLNVDNKPVDRDTTFKVKYLSDNGIVVEVLKERGVNDKKHIQEIVDNHGSVMNVSWLDDYEKDVFRNAFETPQESVLVLAAQRHRTDL